MTISSEQSLLNAPSSRPFCFDDFDSYLASEPSELPEGRHEYWDSALIPVISESKLNDAIANFIIL